jgi:hypothetical protein
LVEPICSSAIEGTPDRVLRILWEFWSSLLERKSDGKNIFIFSTDKGRKAQDDIEKAWKDLYNHYSEILSEDMGKSLTKFVHEASEKLERN